MKVYSADEIRKVEEVENDIGTCFLTLMEYAGTNCAEDIKKRFDRDCGRVAVVAGKGKNGGDGYVIARVLRESGYDVTIVMAFGGPKAEDAITNYQRALCAGVLMLDYSEQKYACTELIESAAVIVDTMFGIGFHGAANEEQTEIFELINNSNGKVIAVDIPSGVETDSGKVNGSAIKADLTYAISTLKPAHVLFPAREYCGETEIIDIGLLPESLGSVSPKLEVYTSEDIKDLLPDRGRCAHKNDFGHVLAICGSKNMPGAAVLCSNAAIRMGAGLLTAAYPENAYPSISPRINEGMNLPLKANENGRISKDSIPELLEFMKKATAIVIGPGLGLDDDTGAVVREVILNAECPMVIDADALNAIADEPEILKQAKGDVLITPHPGEMARLSGLSTGEIADDRIKVAENFANAYGVTVLLKGADTVVAAKGCGKTYVNTTGNQGLAKGGSGDTLAGIAAALLAEGCDSFTAASLAAAIHGAAADYVARKKALRAITATDLIAALPKLLKAFE